MSYALPPGWLRQNDPQGRPYYVNTATGVSTYDDPRVAAGSGWGHSQHSAGTQSNSHSSSYPQQPPQPAYNPSYPTPPQQYGAPSPYPPPSAQPCPTSHQQPYHQQQQQHRPQAAHGAAGGSVMAEKRRAAKLAFAFYDKDRSGYIDMNEFYQALMYLGLTMTWEDSCAVFQIVDNNGNGHVCRQEFIEHYAANY